LKPYSLHHQAEDKNYHLQLEEQRVRQACELERENKERECEQLQEQRQRQAEPDSGRENDRHRNVENLKVMVSVSSREKLHTPKPHTPNPQNRKP
jgi:hypothetical protein